MIKPRIKYILDKEEKRTCFDITHHLDFDDSITKYFRGVEELHIENEEVYGISFLKIKCFRKGKYHNESGPANYNVLINQFGFYLNGKFYKDAHYCRLDLGKPWPDNIKHGELLEFSKGLFLVKVQVINEIQFVSLIRTDMQLIATYVHLDEEELNKFVEIYRKIAKIVKETIENLGEINYEPHKKYEKDYW